MTPLRREFIDRLVLKGYTGHSVDNYVQAVKVIALYYNVSPLTLDAQHRYTILSQKTLVVLKDYFRACRPTQFLFEGQTPGEPLNLRTITAAASSGRSQPK